MRIIKTLVLAVVFTVGLLAGRSLLVSAPLPADPASQPSSAPSVTAGTIKCVVPTPHTWNGEGFTQAFRIASQLGPTICLPDPVDWFDLQGRRREDSKPHKDAQWQNYLMKQDGLNVFIQMDPYKDRRGAIPALPRSVANTFGDAKVRAAFIADALQRVRLYKPKYLCLAMEINAYFEQRPQDFDQFVSLFKEARSRILKEAPSTQVLVSFQYEQLLGLFGGQAGLPKHGPQWELFARFEPEIDAIGISSYPMVSLSPPRFGKASELAVDYYSRIKAHTKKPVVFAELGWASDAAFGGSPRDQADFIRRLPTLLEGLNVPLMNWNFLFDVKGYGPAFESMGLIYPDGNKKPAFDAWKNLKLETTAR